MNCSLCLTEEPIVSLQFPPMASVPPLEPLLHSEHLAHLCLFWAGWCWDPKPESPCLPCRFPETRLLFQASCTLPLAHGLLFAHRSLTHFLSFLWGLELRGFSLAAPDVAEWPRLRTTGLDKAPSSGSSQVMGELGLDASRRENQSSLRRQRCRKGWNAQACEELSAGQ